MEKKMNKLDKLTILLSYLRGEEISQENYDTIVALVETAIEQEQKKKATAHKSDPLKIGFQQAVLSVLTDEGVRASDLLQNEVLLAYAEDNDFLLRIQRITSALGKLSEGENAPVERYEVKKVAYFKLRA